VLALLESEVLRGGEREARREQALARLRNRAARSRAPDCSSERRKYSALS
jgi:hypothetical protein